MPSDTAKNRFFLRIFQKDGVRDVGVLVFLALLVVLKFWNFLLAPTRLYWAGDFIEAAHMRAHFYQCLKKGVFYLWNSRIGGGMPYLGTEFGVFYPFDLLQGLLLADYFNSTRLAWVHAFHFWLAGVFTFLFARQWGLSRIPALISALSFMLGGTMLGHAGHRNVIQGFIWLPLILFFLDQALQRRKASRAVIAGCLLAVSFFGSHTQFFYYILLFVAGYFLFWVYLRIRERSFRKILGDASYFALAAVCCLGLSAVQLLPMLAVSLNSFHGTQSFDWQALFHFPPFNLIHYVIPDYMRWGATDFGEQYGYIGVLPLILAFWAAVQWRDRRVTFLTIVLLFAFVASLGRLTPLYKFLFDYLPGLSQFRIPARFNTLIVFPLTVLAGFGTQTLLGKTALIRQEGRKTMLILLLLLFLVAGIGIFFYLYWVFIPSLVSQGQTIDAWMELHTGFLWFLCFWGASSSAVLGLCRYPASFPARMVLVSVIALDLMVLGPINGGYLREDQAHISPSARKDLETLLRDPQPFRVNNFPGLMNLLYTSREGVAVYDVENLIGYVGTVVPREYLEMYILSEKNPQLLDLWNVKYAVGDLPKVRNGLAVWEIGGENDPKTLVLKDGVFLTRLSLTSFLSHSVSIPQGMEVARVILEKADGGTIIAPIRAGVETAEWAIDRPGLKCLHQKAFLAESWDMPGEGYSGHAYRMEKDYPVPLKLSKIRLEYTAPLGTLLIKKIWINDQDVEEMLMPRFQRLSEGIYRNVFCFPRVFMIGRARAISDEKELWNRMEQWDPRESVLVRALPAGYHPPSASEYGEDEAKIVHYSPSRILIQTWSRKDKFLVLGETYSPYWKAKVDGRPQTVLKVNYGQRGLYLPPGSHQVEFDFHFSPFYYGSAVTLATLAGLFVFLIIRRRKKIPSSTSTS
jgi:hypothetical protein